MLTEIRLSKSLQNNKNKTAIIYIITCIFINNHDGVLHGWENTDNTRHIREAGYAPIAITSTLNLTCNGNSLLDMNRMLWYLYLPG